jgi:hypothetical protein
MKDFFPIIAEWANKEIIYGEHENNNKNPQKGSEKGRLASII